MQTKKKVASKAKENLKTPKKVTAKKAVTKVKVPPEFTMKQVKEIVALIKDAGTFTTFGYKTDEFEIEISVGTPTTTVPAANTAPVSAVSSTPVAAAIPSHSLSLSASERVITSPMIGTFYRRPSPSSPPFVEVGDSVTPTTDVCIVEVMKLLNTIAAECSGTVTRILVEDGETIEVGQPLMVIEVA
ncbi:acetyl-CoA carboxylase biotin carboxyl carrier protein [Polynucleobacter sp. MWH-Braz-FAM2G]|uniref:acetyl-CoA carboxylase biotin carboxyl carrier protein n=1 Tax=Polynucleobacter sp. MWH-Braz-FAM2G TaxID=1855883 RepID=UPI002041484B|nr:acetyl-CoA carboxylase biotin carboxyl carrier protein [Polynucleobacter sp. MWH-Braz-FAM2G]